MMQIVIELNIDCFYYLETDAMYFPPFYLPVAPCPLSLPIIFIPKTIPNTCMQLFQDG